MWLWIGVLFGFMISQVSSELRCFVGSSEPSSSDYPPTAEDCSQQGMTCQISRVKTLDFHIMSCVPLRSCQRDAVDVQSNPSGSLYSEVTCCEENLCNFYPGQDVSDQSQDDLENDSAQLLKQSGFLLGINLLLIANF